ncbi:MAG TPA: tripartite tricarboxylate transporter TctB family protein [Candidatus Limnocylindrales bacterium]|nr:tripartite tricarboxylate transporter TctB family protein [Candidatus Limnocylindrales bacterium]
MPRSLKDVVAGTLFVLFGLGFALGSLEYETGSAARMGPGYFPLVLGGLLTALGGLIVARGFTGGEEGPIGGVSWRAVGFILAAVLVFGVTVRGLGLLPATFIAAVLSALASRRTSVVNVALISVGLTVASMLIFVVALSLRLPLVGPWLRF